MSLIDHLMSPKIRAHLTVRAKTVESRHMLQNLIKSWGFPGTIRVGPDGYLFMDLEGRKATLEKRIEELAHHALVADSTLVTQWLPYTGSYTYLVISF